MTSVAPVLSDGHVLLDALSSDDAEAHTAGEDDEQARRFGWYPQRSTVAGVRAMIVRSEQEWRAGAPRRRWAARNAQTRVLVGGCELRLVTDQTAQISWWVFPPYRRQGIATRAARLVTAYAFEHLGVHRIEACIEPDNLASRGVAHNVGFIEVGVSQGQGTDRPMLGYVLTAHS